MCPVAAKAGRLITVATTRSKIPLVQTLPRREGDKEACREANKEANKGACPLVGCSCIAVDA
jgi:hypothetical protein